MGCQLQRGGPADLAPQESEIFITQIKIYMGPSRTRTVGKWWGVNQKCQNVKQKHKREIVVKIKQSGEGCAVYTLGLAKAIFCIRKKKQRQSLILLV